MEGKKKDDYDIITELILIYKMIREDHQRRKPLSKLYMNQLMVLRSIANCFKFIGSKFEKGMFEKSSTEIKLKICDYLIFHGINSNLILKCFRKRKGEPIVNKKDIRRRWKKLLKSMKHRLNEVHGINDEETKRLDKTVQNIDKLIC